MKVETCIELRPPPMIPSSDFLKRIRDETPINCDCSALTHIYLTRYGVIPSCDNRYADRHIHTMHRHFVLNANMLHAVRLHPSCGRDDDRNPLKARVLFNTNRFPGNISIYTNGPIHKMRRMNLYTYMCDRVRQMVS